MAIPVIQLFLIFARQMSKPVSNTIMGYGKKHPFFRNRILIPFGRGITNITTRLRMRDLGLGRPESLVKISDEAALEQASDFFQEAVLYIYAIGIYTFYYYYTKTSEKDKITHEDLQKMTQDFEEKFDRLNAEIKQLKQGMEMENKTTNSIDDRSSNWWFWSSRRRSEPVDTNCNQPTMTRREALERLSSTRNSVK